MSGCVSTERIPDKHMSLLAIRDLHIHFDGANPVHAVRGINLNLERGQMLAIVGESGSGKSVTALAIMRLLGGNARISGEIMWDGTNLLEATEPAMQALRGRRFGMIFQEPMSALNPLHTIGRQLSESILLHQKLDKSALHARMTELLAEVGLAEFATRMSAYPHQLSGGQRQRVMIAMAIANRPDILIADEPTTALDVSLQTQILDTLKDLQTRLGLAVLLITHDLTLVQKRAERVAIMQQGSIVESGDTREVFANPKHIYTQTLLASQPRGHAVALPADTKELLRCEQLKVSFTTRKNIWGKVSASFTAVENLSLSLKSRQSIGIVGESGSGKTSLGLALIRLIHSEGKIIFMDEHLDTKGKKAMRPLRRSMQIVFQDPLSSLNPRMSVGQSIAEGLRVHAPAQTLAQRDEAVASILERVGLEAAMANRYPHEFSGGQRQRINIARAMILKPALVVLDEPTSALDLTVQSQILDLLKQFQAHDGLSYLFISHDLRVIRAICHEVVVLKSGQLVEHQPTELLFQSPQHDYTKALISAAMG